MAFAPYCSLSGLDKGKFLTMSNILIVLLTNLKKIALLVILELFLSNESRKFLPLADSKAACRRLRKHFFIVTSCDTLTCL
jgi:hypothetical protein